MSLSARVWLEIGRSRSADHRVCGESGNTIRVRSRARKYMDETSRFTAVVKGAFSVFVVCLSFANVLAADMPIPDSKRPQPPPSSAPSRNYEGGGGTLVCGSNALYMLLRLYDIQVDQEQLAATVPVNNNGTSLAELREAAASLGLEATVRRCSLDELRGHVQSPFLAHLAMVSQHYVVVIDVSDDSVTLLDGTTGKLETLKRSWVEERWSGYVLLPRTGATISPILFGVSMLNCLAVGFLATKLFRGSRNRRQISRDL